MTDTATDGDIVRAGFDFFTSSSDEEEAVQAAFAALDRLEARVAELEQALRAADLYLSRGSRLSEDKAVVKIVRAALGDPS